MYFQGLKAIHSPHTGIIDYGLLTRSYGTFFKKHGGKVFTNFPVSSFSITPESPSGSTEGNQYPITITGNPRKV